MALKLHQTVTGRNVRWPRYNSFMVTSPIETAPSSEAARRLLRPEDCALAVIDIQEKLLPPIFEKERLVRNAQLLVRLADILSLPIIVSTQYEKGLGKTVDEISFSASRYEAGGQAGVRLLPQ